MTTHEQAQKAAQEALYLKSQPFCLVAGPPKVGKTSDAYSCLPNGLIIAAPGALKPVVSFIGCAPLDYRQDCPSLVEVIRAIDERVKAGDPKKGLQFKTESGQAMWGGRHRRLHPQG